MAKNRINFINLASAEAFLLDQNDTITPAKFPLKKTVSASRLAYSDLITHSFKLEKRYATTQELTLAVELKMYEDLALDLQKAYRIFYLEKPTEVENIHLIEAFAYDQDAIVQKYEKSFKKIKHLDYLAIPALTFESIYRHHDIPKANDLFLYLGEEEAFLAFYREGRYISSKKVKSLNDMLRELEAKNLRPTLDEFKEILHAKGVCKEHYTLFEYDMYEYVLNTFEQIFSTVKNMTLHNRNIYNFTTLENLYFKFDIKGGVIPQLPELAAGYLPETKLFPLNLWKAPEYEPFNFIDILAAYYVQDHTGSSEGGLNVTFYKKRIPFHRTQSGRFAIAAAAGILLVSLYPAWQQYEIYRLSGENAQLQAHLDDLRQKSKQLQSRYKSIKKEITHYTKAKKETAQKFDRLRRIADTLLELKSQDAHYTTMLMTINELLHKYGLTVDEVSQADAKSLNLEIYSKENRRDTIALFIRDLLKNGFSKASSNEITLDDNAYKSVITVKR